jgi:hypothetical protein
MDLILELSHSTGILHRESFRTCCRAEVGSGRSHFLIRQQTSRQIGKLGNSIVRARDIQRKVEVCYLNYNSVSKKEIHKT